MDKLKKKDIMQKSAPELEKELFSRQIAMRDSRFQASGSKSKNVKEYGVMKRDIARLKTAVRKLAMVK